MAKNLFPVSGQPNRPRPAPHRTAQVAAGAMVWTDRMQAAVLDAYLAARHFRRALHWLRLSAATAAPAALPGLLGRAVAAAEGERRWDVVADVHGLAVELGVAQPVEGQPDLRFLEGLGWTPERISSCALGLQSEYSRTPVIDNYLQHF